MNHYEALEYIRDKIGGCFGDADGIFAEHPFDEARARELRQIAFETGITIREIEQITSDFMETKGYDSDHRYEQMGSIHNFFKKKLR